MAPADDKIALAQIVNALRWAHRVAGAREFLRLWHQVGTET
jgi:hypothetical protein